MRDVIVQLTKDGKLRKDALTKDYELKALLNEGEANELARSRAATVEQKSVHRINHDDDEEITDEEAEFMIAKLQRAGKYSTKAQKVEPVQCDRCVNSRNEHTEDKCYFKDKECRKCNKKGHMQGSTRCSKTKKVKKVALHNKTDDLAPAAQEDTGAMAPGKEITLRKVEKKNEVRVKVGGMAETNMFADSGADVTIVPVLTP